MVALTLSMTMTWHADKQPTPGGVIDEPPVPPAFTQAALPLELQRDPPELLPLPLPLQARAAPSTPRQFEPAQETKHALAVSATPPLPTGGRVKARPHDWRRKPGPVTTAASRHASRALLVRRAADPQREYIASRNEVAAFTGEDSGSAYLARLAPRRARAPAVQVSQAQARR